MKQSLNEPTLTVLFTYVQFFMDDCLQQLIDRIDAGEGELLKNLVLSERLSKLVRMRLEMQGPYISKWPQALSIQVLHYHHLFFSFAFN